MPDTSTFDVAALRNGCGAVGPATGSPLLAPYACGRYLNFVEEAYDLREVFGEESYRRLVAMKAQYDPDGLFHANHPITTTP